MSNNKYYSNAEVIDFILKQFVKLRKHNGFKYNHNKYPGIDLDALFIGNIQSILFTELTLNPALGKFETQSIIKESIFLSFKRYGNDVNLDDYINVIRDLESEKLKKANVKYIFYNSFSGLPKALNENKFENSWGAFRRLKSWPQNIKDSKEWRFAVELAGYKPPDNFHVLKTIVEDRNPYDAADKAWKCIDIERAFWNFNLTILSEQLLPTSKPINKAFFGPVHFTKHDDILTFFYEPTYKDNFNSNDPELSKFRVKYYEKDKEKYSEHFDKQFLDEALVKYSNALDLPDKNFVITKLWELLEYLMCLRRNENYDQLIKRICNLFDNEYVIKMSLDHIRKARNEYIHASNDIDPHSPKTLFMLKSIVDMILLFHLDNGSRFNDLKEYKEYLNLPGYNTMSDVSQDLKRKIQLVEKKSTIPQLSSRLTWRK